MWTKRLLTAAVLLGLAGLVAVDAQWGGGKGRGGRGGQRGDRAAGPFAQLELTEDQKAAIKSLRETQREQMQTGRAAGTLDREAVRAAREAHHQAVMELLTPEQRSTLEELRADAPQRGARGRRRGGAGISGPRGAVPGGRGPGALGQLELTEDQQDAIVALRETHREQMQAMRAAGPLDREAVKAAREAHHQAVTELLTPEQQSTLEELRSQRPQRGRRGGRRGGPGGAGLDEGAGVWERGPMDTGGDEAAAGSQALQARMWPNSPNPFNPETLIAFELPWAAQVQLEVYDVLGRRVRTLASESYSAGTHSVMWNGRGDEGHPVAGGVYFARLVADGQQAVQRMLLVK